MSAYKAFAAIRGKLTAGALVLLYACNLAPREAARGGEIGRAWAHALRLETGGIFIPYGRATSTLPYFGRPFWRFAPWLRLPAAVFQSAAFLYVTAIAYDPDRLHQPKYWAPLTIYLVLMGTSRLLLNWGHEVELRSEHTTVKRRHMFQFKRRFAASCEDRLHTAR